GLRFKRFARSPHEMPAAILDRTSIQSVRTNALVVVENHRERHRILTLARARDQRLCRLTLAGIGGRSTQLFVELAPQAERSHGTSVPVESFDPGERKHPVVEHAGLEIAGVEVLKRLSKLVLDGAREGSPRDQQSEGDAHEG